MFVASIRQGRRAGGRCRKPASNPSPSALFSFLHPDHERLVQRAISMSNLQLPILNRQAPTARQSIPSSPLLRVLPEYREYERTSTTVINAYVAPLMARYLGRLEAALGGRRLHVMQSNGGVISAATAKSLAARTVLSGPAGGIVGALAAAKRAGFDRAITFDMGGTSTDVALCDGSLPTTTEGEVAGCHAPAHPRHSHRRRRRRIHRARRRGWRAGRRA
jgi:N-methylhydantoinase A